MKDPKYVPSFSKLVSVIALAALLTGAGFGVPVLAQQGRPAQQSGEAPRGNAPQNAPQGEAGARPAQRPQNENAFRLPADSMTDHTVELPGRSLHFKATAGSIPLNDAESGALQAQVAYVAYTLGDAADPNRPVTFLFNGGPGAASAYLDIGAVGPWRLPLDNISASVTPVLTPNADTWLEFTDLVFIDPVATGYSRFVANNDNVRRSFFSVDGDGRQASAKFLVGESYGGFRVPKVARSLTGRQGVGVRGLIMISPVLDFGSFGLRRHMPMSWVTRLPSMAATVFESKGPFNRDALRDVEAYASGDYLHDLMRGERDTDAIDRMTPRVATYTGIDPAEVKRLGARVDTQTFQRELNRERGMVASAYDPTITAFDPSPRSANGRFSDPVLDAIGPPITSAMTALYKGPLKWRVEQPYRLLNGEINGQWNWGRGRVAPEVVEDLRNALASDRELQVLVAHGASDLVTPYFAGEYAVSHMRLDPALRRNVILQLYPGGHSMYSEKPTLHQMFVDVGEFIRKTTPAKKPTPSVQQ
jgi:carboxypeptidase C (cathepsin A)